MLGYRRGFQSRQTNQDRAVRIDVGRFLKVGRDWGAYDGSKLWRE